MSRSYPVITLWLLENPFDIITLWQLQEGKCSISSPTSPLFWEPGASLFSTSWSAKCLWGSVWGALLISAPRPVRAWEFPIKAVDSGGSQSGDGQWAYYYQCAGWEITRVQEKSTWFYLKDHWNISLPSAWHYISISKRSPRCSQRHYPRFSVLICLHVRQGLFSTDSFK